MLVAEKLMLVAEVMVLIVIGDLVAAELVPMEVNTKLVAEAMMDIKANGSVTMFGGGGRW